MAQVIFVHGVATRSGPQLNLSEANMKLLFGKTVFKGVPFEIRAPHWGDLVPRIPADVFETDNGSASFALMDGDVAFGGGVLGEGSGQTIGEIASSAPQLAIDAVLAAVVDEAETEERELDEAELAAFAAAVVNVADAEKSHEMVAGASSDDELAEKLTPDSGSYGIVNPIKKAVEAVTDRIRNVASGLGWPLVEGSIRPAVGLFLGDVFAYLYDGTLRDAIRDVVREKLLEGWAAQSANEPFIVIGHSMGGVILVDMLADLGGAGLPADFKIDALFTVGSQPGLFQAVGALRGGPPAAGAKRPAPSCVAHWFNVFDPIDPLAFRTSPIFDNVVDLEFNSITGVASAHTTYFKRPQFYARFGKRISDLNLVR